MNQKLTDQFSNLIKKKNQFQYNTYANVSVLKLKEFLSKCICIYFSKGDNEYFEM